MSANSNDLEFLPFGVSRAGVKMPRSRVLDDRETYRITSRGGRQGSTGRQPLPALLVMPAIGGTQRTQCISALGVYSLTFT